MPQQYTSRYQIIEYDDGFRIAGRERTPVEVRLSPNKTWLFISDGGDPSRVLASLNMYAYPVIRDTIINTLMEQWTAPIDSHYWPGAYEWAKGQARKALQQRLHAQWQRLLSLVPEPKRLVVKAVFAATFDFRHPGCETWDAIYEHPFLVQDIIKYRAAAIACHYAVTLTGLTEPTIGMARRDFSVLHDCNNDYDMILDYLNTESEPRNQPNLYSIQNPIVIERLTTDWKVLFSSNGKAHRNLCRMLMNLPGNIPAKLLCNLPDIEFALNRPITDRIELLMLLNEEHRWQQTEYQDWYIDIIIKANRKDILTALQIVSSDINVESPSQQQKFRPTKMDFNMLITYIQDYYREMEQEENMAYHGNLVGLARRSVRWHQEMRQRPRHVNYNMYGDMMYGNTIPFSSRFDEKTQTALPPIPLPEDPHITFLANVGAVYREGQTMQHCIASYAGGAVQGECYLFHIDYQDTAASTMIDARGRMVQSFGPHNVTNAASRYGAQVLGSWGTGFGTSTPKSSQYTHARLEMFQAAITQLMQQLQNHCPQHFAEHVAACQAGVTQLMEEFQNRGQHTAEDFVTLQTAIAQLLQELR